MAVDENMLQHWRNLDASHVLAALADHVKEDPDFKPLKNSQTTRWHARVGTYEFELLCTGPKFLDTRAGQGGGGAVDMAMHLLGLSFKKAVSLLRSKNL